MRSSSFAIGEAKSESGRTEESLGTFFFQMSFIVPYLDFGNMNAAEYSEFFSWIPVIDNAYAYAGVKFVFIKKIG